MSDSTRESTAEAVYAVPIGATRWLRAALDLGDGETPFPWQEQLLAMFELGRLPRALDIPTGLGKTAVMAIWLVARAAGAKLPRRLVYVVDRRAVVDQATDVASALRELVDREPELKAGLGLDANRSLPISTLRGQHVDNREWLEDPASPAIIVGTVDMIGSRLLFEGYGVSRKMRPYHAGLLGADTLVVLDEAHLVPPFEKLLESIAQGEAEYGPREESLRAIVPRLKLLSLSATGRTAAENSFGLTDKDLEHPIVRKRLDAGKRLSLEHMEVSSTDDAKKDLADALAREAYHIVHDGAKPRIVVFCDSREVAAETKAAVERLAIASGTAIDTELFVGGRRVHEREEAKKRLVDLGFIAGSGGVRGRPAFLFATSAAEVGVDLDADHMVSDLVAWERMVQRLGRVNRRGEGDATVLVVVAPEPKPNKQEQKAIDKDGNGGKLNDKERKLIDVSESRRKLWKAYQSPYDQLPRDEMTGDFDASPGALRAIKQHAEKNTELKAVLDEATTPAPLRPALNRALVDAWSMTSLKGHTGRPEIDPWLRGWVEDDPPQTAVIWRTHLPVRSDSTNPTQTEIEDFFEAAPSHTSEVLETESYRVAEWLEARAKTVSEKSRSDSSLPAPEDTVAILLSRAGDFHQNLRLGALADGNDLLSALGGATLVVDHRLAGLRREGLLDTQESVPPRTADGDEEWFGQGAIGFRIRSLGVGEQPAHDAAWRERLRFAVAISAEGEPQRWLVVEKWRSDAATEEDRSSSRPQLLDEHQTWAEEEARSLGERLGLGERFVEMLAAAGRVHDEGKRAPRWQRAFNAPADGLYAKTRGPINISLLDGYRHEFGSLLTAQQTELLTGLDEDLQDLALHLIAAHHGFARPVIGIRGCQDAPPSALEEQARVVAVRFARVQERWGSWGLAWWEALLRAADQQASRDNDAGDSIAPPIGRVS